MNNKVNRFLQILVLFAGILFVGNIKTALCLEVFAGDSYVVAGVQNYLALRNEMAYDANNEIGKLKNGDVVELVNTGNGTYWYVFSGRLNSYGYVNGSYLQKVSTVPVPVGGYSYYVTGTENYLALRNEMAYDRRNEIGRLYNGDQVLVLNHGDNKYWYVYSPQLDKYGYVDGDYLMLSDGNRCDNTPQNDLSACSSYVVKGTQNYLAVRSAMKYDRKNEIGKLYNGDTVQLINTGNGEYWYIYASKLNLYGYVNSQYLY